MLAEGRTARSPVPAWLVLALLVALVGLSVVSPPARAVNPTWVTNANSTRSVTWRMDDPSGIALDQVELSAGQAVLPWQSQNLSWTQANQFRQNGTLDSRMTANASGLGLRSNWTNTVTNPTFSAGAPWQYANGSSGNVTAEWNTSAGAGEINASWEGDQVLWESMDSVAAHWTGSGALVVQNTTVPAPKQGSGSMAIDVATGGAMTVGAVNSSLSTLNWSEYDRMVLWIYLNTTISASFNVTAHAGLTGPLVTTTAQALTPARGWQEVTVDLNQLGGAATRSNLVQVVLRFSAPSPFASGTWFNIDDVRLGTARVFDEAGAVSQAISKANETTPLAGSGRLSFDWRLTPAGNVSVTTATVALGSWLSTLGSGSSGTWQSFSADVSAATAAAGAYTLQFSLRVGVNTTGSYDVGFLVDNVTLVFPQMANATYTSNVLTMGQASQYLSLAWSGSTPASTTVQVGVRTGNSSVPTPAEWSHWQTVSTPGVTALTRPGAMHFQVQIQLNTTNASSSPVIQTLSLATRHRASSGTVTADIFTATSFLWWRTFAVNETLPPNTTISFVIGNGQSGTPVQPGANLTAYAGGPNLTWQAALVTTDGLATPALMNVTLVYDFQGGPAHVVVRDGQRELGSNDTIQLTTGESVSLMAAVYDSGNHLLPAAVYPVAWQVDNSSGGSVASNGTYVAGKPGTWHIIATVIGTNVYASVRVNVTASSGSTSLPATLWDYWPAFLVLAAGVVGFSLYELVVRRMFAIDDVFLIAKDGRLIIHNTRRMRADRDEDILSGMLTAIMAFLRDSDPEENGEFKQFEVGGKTTLLERGEHVYLTAIYSGRVPGWARKDLHRFMLDLEYRFGDAFASWTGSPEDLHGLKDYMQRFVSHVRYHSGSSGPSVES